VILCEGPKIRFEGLKYDEWDGSGRRFDPPGAIDPGGYAGRYGVSWKTRFVREIRRFWSVMIFSATMRVVFARFFARITYLLSTLSTHTYRNGLPSLITQSWSLFG